MKRNERILLIDDEAHILQSYRTVLRQIGFRNFFSCHSANEAKDIISQHSPDIILLDLTLKGEMPGQELLPILRQRVPDSPVIIISGNQDMALAVECMKRGAHDYLSKPVEGERLKATVLRTLEWKSVRNENAQLKNALLQTETNSEENNKGIVTHDHHMKNLLAYTRIIASSPEPVLITGESGVGKEMFARAVHELGDGRAPWVAVNVTALNDDMFADALFGHRRGAFTGADKMRSGLLEKAAGGTLLLDEIGDLSMASQVKLLRLLQEKEYHPVGADAVKHSDCRIIATTNRLLEDRIKNGTFRSDLYYRLKVHHIHIPPLRERRDDIVPLAEYFTRKAAKTLGIKAPGIDNDAKSVLMEMSFPGNARQVEALIFDAVTRYKEKPIPVAFFRQYQNVPASKINDKYAGQHDQPQRTATSFCEFQILPTIQQARLELIDEAVHRCRGNRSAAARMLGITPQALHKHLNKH